MFFPWGYQVVDQIQYFEPFNLKGDTSVCFSLSSVDTTQHDILKIVYNPGNGQDLLIINRPILPTVIDVSNSSILDNRVFDSPIYQSVTFVYSASSQPVTYTPSITALYGDMTRLFYFFNFIVYPNSIYDVENVHLIETTQLGTGQSLNILEVGLKSLVVNVVNTLSS